MESLILSVEVVAVAGACAVLGALGLVARRFLLFRRPGTFDCAVLVRPRPWSMGVARYETDELIWYGFFSLRPGPSRRWGRRELAVQAVNRPAPNGGVAARSSLVVVECLHGGQAVDFALAPDVATGFSSWLESAPPGITSW